ncbi:MucB/RseB C-terminal domain-containing protein [Xylophilus sp.]|uniref:MucB/RseB C-terminal domain-containing protein n=1 Tax=Xylophilus sp. TaxID=2653893 RepID=UPI0013B62F0E|nr:MucB/RseB C-terminal domain-containing protein [Xylophilus sp.]KAF1045809.1 MAG: Sigma factor AlgU regulatory protein MucB [Xylophilus sp.]
MYTAAAADPSRRLCFGMAAAGFGWMALAPGIAFAGDTTAAESKPAAQRDLRDWLALVQEASRRRSYTGIFVVMSAAGTLSSSRIWHACDGDQQFERVEALSGPPRATFRHNDRVITFLPEERIARIERRQTLDLFPNLLQGSAATIPDHYDARLAGTQRVAGIDAHVVDIRPRDHLRFGYRIWSEKRTGLVVKMQTLDAHGAVLEQAAFSELEIDVPIKIDRLLRMMEDTAGYRIDKVEPTRTTPEQEGWMAAAPPVAGFAAIDCYRRPVRAAAGVAAGAMQCVFSDGLASVSLFLEPYDTARQPREQTLAVGATHTLGMRLDDHWWLTAMGEVPQQTLRVFAGRFVRGR